MSVWIQAFAVTLPTLYMAAAILFAMAFGGENAPQLPRARRSVFLATMILHGFYLALKASAAGALPLSDTWMLISSITWITALLFAGITWRHAQPTVGAFVLGLCTLLQLSASAWGTLAAPPAQEPDAFRALHSATSVLASSALLLSGTYGFLHLVLYRQMRRRQFGALFRDLPDLELLSRMMRRAALAGFLFLTLGLNLGIILGHSSRPGGFNYSDPHVLLTLALWVHFGLIAFSGHIGGITARRASWAATAGLVSLLLLIVLTLVPSMTAHAL